MYQSKLKVQNKFYEMSIRQRLFTLKYCFTSIIKVWQVGVRIIAILLFIAEKIYCCLHNFLRRSAGPVLSLYGLQFVKFLSGGLDFQTNVSYTKTTVPKVYDDKKVFTQHMELL